jgi:hypothetical protein
MYPKFVQTRPSVIYKGETSVVSTGKCMTGGQGAMKAAHHGVRTFGVLPLLFSARSGSSLAPLSVPSGPMRLIDESETLPVTDQPVRVVLVGPGSGALAVRP